MVYGSTEEIAERLRTGEDGLMREQEGGLMPFEDNRCEEEGSGEEGSGEDEAIIGQEGEMKSFLSCTENHPKLRELKQLFCYGGFLSLHTVKLRSFLGRHPMFFGGDVRASENPGLQSMHTIWLREHNRLARAVKATSQTELTDEEIYQTARR